MKMSAIVIALFVALAASLGVGLWVAPELIAPAFRLESVGTAGVTTLRADLGGLFAGLALLSLIGIATGRRSLLVAAAVVLAAIAAGRLIGMLASGEFSSQAASLAIEAVTIAALARYARGLEATVALRQRWPIGWKPITVGVATATGVVALLLNPGVELWLFERLAAQRTGRDTSHLFADDALGVAVCGSSAPLPSAARAKPCVALLAGGRFYVIDVGPESVENLVRWGIPLSQIGGVFLTHFHSDHIGDLGELNLQTWAAGRPRPLAVYGGPGVERVVAGFTLAYATDQTYRTDHHSERVMPAATWPMSAQVVDLPGQPTPAKDRTALALADGDLRVTAIEVDHAPIAPAYAYRFDYRGRSVVVSGDLKAHPPLAAAARGADLLVSEAIARPMVRALQDAAAAAGRGRQATILHDIQDYHVSPAEAAGLANQAGVRLLVFYHLLPAPDGLLARRLFGNDVNRVRRGDWTIADDGSLYTLPVGSTDVRLGRIDR